MQKTNFTFTTELVDGSNFRKSRKLWGIVSILYALAIFIGPFLFDDEDMTLKEKFLSPISIISYSIFFIAIAAYFYLRKKNPIGTLTITDKFITIQQADNKTFNHSNLENLEMQRGATHHYAHDVTNELIKVNNFLRFKEDGKAYEYEFIIDSKQKNQAFETMIQALQKNGIKVHYTSI